jgi:hypothetical protein
MCPSDTNSRTNGGNLKPHLHDSLSFTPSVVWHIGLAVEEVADAVAAICPDHRAAVPGSMRTDNITDVSISCFGFADFYSSHQALVRDLQLSRSLPNGHGLRGRLQRHVRCAS